MRIFAATVLLAGATAIRQEQGLVIDDGNSAGVGSAPATPVDTTDTTVPVEDYTEALRIAAYVNLYPFMFEDFLESRKDFPHVLHPEDHEYARPDECVDPCEDLRH